MVNCTCAVDASSARPISGSDGRYMSIDIGPSAVNSDSNNVSASVPGRSIGNQREFGRANTAARAPWTYRRRLARPNFFSGLAESGQQGCDSLYHDRRDSQRPNLSGFSHAAKYSRPPVATFLGVENWTDRPFRCWLFG